MVERKRRGEDSEIAHCTRRKTAFGTLVRVTNALPTVTATGRDDELC